MIGKSLAHYEITAEIGKGGMGEVYQAKDTKLGRDVAIKVLPEEFARDVDRIARFQREAKLLASLNHPNIASIHEELEETEGAVYLVLEYVPGQTLDERIAKGGLTLKETLSIVCEIAEAISYAHDKGVIHRDLKPGNIKISTDRAKTVYDALLNANISSPKLTYKGVGSDELLPDYDPRAGEQRRVTFKIVPE